MILKYNQRLKFRIPYRTRLEVLINCRRLKQAIRPTRRKFAQKSWFMKFPIRYIFSLCNKYPLHHFQIPFPILNIRLLSFCPGLRIRNGKMSYFVRFREMGNWGEFVSIIQSEIFDHKLMKGLIGYPKYRYPNYGGRI